MKKAIFLNLFLILCVSVSVCHGAIERRQDEFFEKPANEAFFKKLKTCSPATLSATGEKIYGKTKNNMCHYGFSELDDKGELRQYDCMLPFSVAYGYATSSLNISNELRLEKERLLALQKAKEEEEELSKNPGDMIGPPNNQYEKTEETAASQDVFNYSAAREQNYKIRLILRDYCNIKTK